MNLVGAAKRVLVLESADCVPFSERSRFAGPSYMRKDMLCDEGRENSDAPDDFESVNVFDMALTFLRGWSCVYFCGTSVGDGSM